MTEEIEVDKKIDSWFDKLKSFRNSSTKVVSSTNIVALKTILKDKQKEEKA